MVNQRNKLLDYLKEHGSITTNKAHSLLDIYYPPARVFELKSEGHLINIVWATWSSDYGIKHRVAKYVLKHAKPLESANESGVL